jgi:carboxypeptidase family protein
MRRMTRTKRTKTGSKLVGSKLVGSKLVALLVCGLLSSAAGKKPEPYAVVAGTVFREDGFSLPGASVTLLPKDAPKGKKLEAVSDARGEFAFRVPAGAAAYVVKAARKGFQPAEKEASVSGEGRVDVTLILSAESK